MAADPSSLVTNIFLAGLVIAQFEVALVAVFWTLVMQTDEIRYKKAIHRSVLACIWFLGISLAALGIAVFASEIPSWVPAFLFVMVVIGAAVIMWGMWLAAGWKLVDSFPQPTQKIPKVIEIDMSKEKTDEHKSQEQH